MADNPTHVAWQEEKARLVAAHAAAEASREAWAQHVDRVKAEFSASKDLSKHLEAQIKEHDKNEPEPELDEVS